MTARARSRAPWDPMPDERKLCGPVRGDFFPGVEMARKVPLLKVADVCRMLGVSRTWVYDASADGRIPSVHLGGPDGPLRFVQADLDAWLEEARAQWTPGRSDLTAN